MWHIERDYSSASQSNALSVTRVYNSSPYNWDKSVAHAFGTRWTQPYDAILRPESVPNTGAGKCWRREDTLYVWCDSPAAPQPSAIPDSVSILRGDGKKARFNRSGTAWSGRLDSNDRLTATYSEDGTAILSWTFVSAQGDMTERFDASGTLISIAARNGATQRFTYSDGINNDTSAGRVPADAPVCTQVQLGNTLPAGRLMCVTDHWGRQLNFEYDIKGRIEKVIDPAQQTYLYEYDGPSGGCITADITNPACSAGNLTKITFPDGKSRIYFYNEALQINGGVRCTNAVQIGNGFGNLLNAWTGLIDENGVRHISWTYDCLEHATSSQLAQGANKVTITYPGGSGRTVTHYFGTSANPQTRDVNYYYSGSPILGVVKNTSISGPCAECGDAAERLYDSSGNITSLQDWSGKYICFAYGQGRNLETVRVEGGGASACSTMLNATTLTLPSRKISTQWHAIYNLPLMIAAPKKLTTYNYDSAGNLLSKSERATNDPTGIQAFGATPVGALRTWTYTYNAVGQMQTVTGPRTDVNDTTTYSYDNQGNLVTITNAAGHVTSLSNYDAHGRVGRISAPNGTVTDMSYTQRGWLSSRTVTAGSVTQTTTYDYDSGGQLTHVVLPGGSSISYTYDDAHRLTGISDEIGNSVLYTLDFRGNRLKEQVTDPAGSLARQVSRVYDTRNRLQQQTGGVQ
jgi:YD repeat-containing protein